MTDDKALVERLRVPCFEIGLDEGWIDAQRNKAADRIEDLIAENERLRKTVGDRMEFYLNRIEALSAENERLREELSGISGRLNIMREALIHTAGICNPASGFLKNATGVRKKHIENVCDIARAALGDTE